MIGTVVAGVDEQEALQLVADLQRRFKWKVAVFTTEDLRKTFQYSTDRHPTDDDLASVMLLPEWKVMGVAMYSAGFERISDAVITHEAQRDE